MRTPFGTHRQQRSGVGAPGEALCAACVFTLIALLWLLPLVGGFSTSVLTPNTLGFKPTDGTSLLTDYWSVREAGETPFTLTRNHYIAAPEGVPRSRVIEIANPLVPALLHFLQPILGLVAAWNAILIAGLVGNAVAAFAFLRYVGVRLFAAGIGAYTVAFAPWVLEKAKWGHLGLLHLWPIPLAAILVVRALRLRTAKSLLVAGAASGAVSYASFYVGVLMLTLLSVTLLLYVVHARTNVPQRLRQAAVVLAAALSTLVPLAVLYGFGETTIVVARGSEDFIGVGLREFLRPVAGNPALDVVDLPPHGGGDRDLYLGTTTVVAAALSFLLAWRRPRLLPVPLRATALAGGALVVAGMALALPRYYVIAGSPVPMPSLLATTVLPEFRVVARYGVLALLGGAAGAAVAYHLLEKRRYGRQLLLLVAAATVVQLATGPPIHTWATEAAPPHVDWLRQRQGGIVAVYPMLRFGLEFANMETEEYAYQRLHRHPLFNLYGGDARRFVGTRQLAIRGAAKFLDQSDTARVLATAGVRYVVVRKDAYRALGDAPPESFAGARRVFTSPLADIHAVSAEPLDGGLDAFIAERRESIHAAVSSAGVAARLVPAGFHAPEPQPDGTTRRWLREHGSIQLVNEGWSGPVEIAFRAASAGTRSRRLVLRAEDGSALLSATVTPTDTIVEARLDALPKGTSTVAIEVSPGPERLSPSDARLGTISLSTITVSRPLIWRRL